MIATFQMKLIERHRLTDHVYYFSFVPVDHSFSFKAGQYVILHIPQAEGHPARRLYSMASPDSKPETIDLIVELIPNGVASTHLMQMNIGDTITAQGPAGMFTLFPEPTNSVFLATGTGIAPMRSMIHHLIENHSDKKLYLFWGFPTMETVYLQEELITLARNNPNFTFVNCLSREQDLACVTNEADRGHYALGHINDGLENTVPGDLAAYHYYICGGPKVIESMREFLTGKAIPKEQIHFEKFTG